MDLLLKYLEGNTFYEIEDWFYNQLGLYSLEDSSHIIAQTLAVVDFLPKIKMEMIVSSDMVEQVTSTIVEAARTGKIGDGKILCTVIEL